jgi:hypothetical protein
MRILATNAPVAVILVRLIVGGVVLSAPFHATRRYWDRAAILGSYSLPICRPS